MVVDDDNENNENVVNRFIVSPKNQTNKIKLVSGGESGEGKRRNMKQVVGGSQGKEQNSAKSKNRPNRDIISYHILPAADS